MPVCTLQHAVKERKTIDINTKMVLIKQYEGERKVNTITRDLKLLHSKLPSILKDREIICKVVKGSAPR